MRKESIGYLPKFDEAEDCICDLLEFFKEEKSSIKLEEYVETCYGIKNRNTIRLLQNTLLNYGLIRETEDYIFVITNEGRQWLQHGGKEELIQIIHEHIAYIGELLEQLEKQKMSREELQNRALQYYGIEFNNTDITRRLQIFKSVGMVRVNRHKQYELTEYGSQFLQKITLEKKTEGIRKSSAPQTEKQQEFFLSPAEVPEFELKAATENGGKKEDECNIEKIITCGLYEKVIKYIEDYKSFYKVALAAKVQCKGDKNRKELHPDILIYRERNCSRKLVLGIEIVMSNTRNDDFLNKLFLYKCMGFPECWMVDYMFKKILVFDWKNNHFSIHDFDDNLEHKEFKGLLINLEELLQNHTQVLVIE
ncbi:MAG: Uma2 family endonuclease [Eubacteriales bacterium]|nr:Uma2 family endonuclease [Eubacteriales bacterium]